MENRRFIALGDLIADCYYIDKKMLGLDGGSSRFNVIANLSQMGCKNAVIGGCGNDKIGQTIIKRLSKMETDISKVFLRDRNTRAYHLTINKENLPRITYQCSKKSPKTGQSTWYEDTIEDIPYYEKEIKNTDVVVLDTLDETSLEIMDKFECDKVLDIGNTKRLETLSDEQISVMKNKLEILQLNERVVPYLKQRFGCTDILEIYKLLNPKLMIVTYGKDGAEFAFENTVHSKEIAKSANEIDATGAGDAFFSVFIKKYYDNSKKVDKEFIDATFENAVALTTEVVQNVGARGHLYKKELHKSSQKNKTELMQRVEVREGISKEKDDDEER